MATKLKNLKVKKVDFVDEGANPDANIKLFKRRNGSTEGHTPTSTDAEEKSEGVWKKLFSYIAKAAGIEPADLNSAMEEVEKSGSVSFGAQMNERKTRKIADEIWDVCFALESSLVSIIHDDELDSSEAQTAMQESLDDFCETVQSAISQWSSKKSSNISKNSTAVTAYDLDIIKSARDRLNETIEKACKTDNAGEKKPPNDSKKGKMKEGDSEEMKIDKSKLTESERAFLESIEKRYGMEDEAGAAQSAQNPTGGTGAAETDPATTNDETVAKALQQLGLSNVTKPQNEPDDIYKGLNPVVKAQLDELMKFKRDAEERELREIAKKYAILGKKEEDLLPVLKSTKAASQEAYDQLIATLDGAVETVENSGAFNEIGRNGHTSQIGKSSTATTTAEGKIAVIAKSYMEKNPDMTYVEANAKAWEDNPDLVSQYEQEAGL